MRRGSEYTPSAHARAKGGPSSAWAAVRLLERGRRRWLRRTPVASVILLAWLLGVFPWPVTPVLAATITVTTTSDDFTPANGQCSLREAIQVANTNSNATFTECAVSGMLGNDTITLQSGQTYTLSLDITAGNENSNIEDDLDIAAASTAGTLTIQGNGATIQRDASLGCSLDFTDPAGEFRIFEVLGGGNLTLQNVTVQNGCADDDTFFEFVGGGIYVANGGTLNATTSTISGNSAGHLGGGIRNFSTVTLTNSTISGNSADGDGGGIWNEDTVNTSFVTIANNSAGAAGGGIFNDGGAVSIKNSIVGDNTAGVGPNCSGDITASAANLATDTTTMSCGTTNFTYVALTALNLGPLANNGGTTQTHALQSTSAAIDAVSNCTDLKSPNPQQVTTDQPGVRRPQGNLCDVGAYEAPAPPPSSSNVLRLQSNGSCLELDRDRRIYRFRAANGRVFTRPLRFTPRGSRLEFQSPRGQSPLLKGTIDLNRRTGSAALVVPLSQGAADT